MGDEFNIQRFLDAQNLVFDTVLQELMDGSMRGNEALSLPGRLELTHPSLPYPGRLMRLLCEVILIPISTVDCLGHQLTMCHTIAAQFVRHDLPGFSAMTS